MATNVNGMTTQARIYRHIESYGNEGATSAETREALGMRNSTTTAGIRNLTLEGFVEDSGRTREGPSGKGITVWVAVPADVREERAEKAMRGKHITKILRVSAKMSTGDLLKVRAFIEELAPEDGNEEQDEEDLVWGMFGDDDE